MSDPLTPEERAFWNKRVGLPGEGLMARDFRRLLDQVASLTAERDSLKPPYESAILAAVRETIWAERGLLAEVRAERDAALARLEKARGLVLEFAANMGPGFFDSYPTLVKLRAALTGTEGPP